MLCVGAGGRSEKRWQYASLMMAATNWTPERAGGVANAFCAGLLTGGGELQPNSGNEPGIVFTPMVESER